MAASTPEKRPVRVTILSQSYTVLTAGDPREVEELARSLDELMLSIAAQFSERGFHAHRGIGFDASGGPAAHSGRDLNQLKERVDRKSEEFAGLLEQAIEGGG